MTVICDRLCRDTWAAGVQLGLHQLRKHLRVDHLQVAKGALQRKRRARANGWRQCAAGAMDKW